MAVKELFCKIEDSTTKVENFFGNNQELTSLYLTVQDEIWKCDPDLLFCAKNGLIGVSKKDEKYRFYIAPTKDGYDIKFAHLENKMFFDPYYSMTLLLSTLLYSLILKQ